jgi:serine/threonine-protein kinase
MGFRVLMSSDPNQAVKRYQQGPYHALIVDAGTVGRDGLDAYRKVLREAELTGLDVAAILILNEDQANLAGSVEPNKCGEVMVRPVGMKQLAHALRDRIPELLHPETAGSGPTSGRLNVGG